MNALIVIFLLSYLMYTFIHDKNFLILYGVLVFIYTIVTQKLIFPTSFDKMRNKLTIATWGTPNDPQIYGQIELDVTKVEPYLEQLSKKIGKKITFTMYSIKLLSLIINKFPELNSYIKYGLLNAKDGVDLCCLVAIGDGEDLANAVIQNSDKKNISTIINELEDSVKNLREKKNKDHNQKGKIANAVPNFILAILVQLFSYISSIGLGFKPVGVSFNLIHNWIFRLSPLNLVVA